MANDTIEAPKLHTLLNEDNTIEGFTVTVKRDGKNRRAVFLTREEAIEIAHAILDKDGYPSSRTPAYNDAAVSADLLGD